MMGNGFDFNTLTVRMHMNELRSAADEARRARQVYRPSRLRRRMGQMLIVAGETLAR